MHISINDNRVTFEETFKQITMITPQTEREAVIIGTIQGQIEACKVYLEYADPLAVKTIQRTEIELNCLEKLLKQIESE